ncbi:MULTISPECIES: AAA family ATPase [unclassified Kitasatospora]|uniref:AAA family ATPase n=1 Tax=unclassified Kitasatospora TaxID=2633591 RepID=UPI002473BA73|nr:AAA family ATPase [Kitasatospora sp. MAP12-44]
MDQLKARELAAWSGRKAEVAGQAATSKMLDTFREHLLAPAQMLRLPSAPELIQGILAANSLVWLWGPPKQGKTFIAHDWAGHVGAGMPWQGREVTKGRVLYVVAEGAAGYRKRIPAWENYHEYPMTGVTFFNHPLQLLDHAQHSAFLVLIEELRPALVVIDTQSRCTVGKKENDADTMSGLVAALDQIRVAAGGACVLTLHHGERTSRNMRGSSVVDGAADTTIKVTRDQRSPKSPIKLTCTAQKDDAPFGTIALPVIQVDGSLVIANQDPQLPDSLSGGGAAVGSNPTWKTVHLSGLQADILTLLQRQGRHTVKELAEHLKKHRDTINDAVKALVKQGFAERATPYVQAVESSPGDVEEAA